MICGTIKKKWSASLGYFMEPEQLFLYFHWQKHICINKKLEFFYKIMELSMNTQMKYYLLRA